MVPASFLTWERPVKLLPRLQHRGFNVYVNNCYKSIPLHTIHACGTIQTNRKHFPKGLPLAAVSCLNMGKFVWVSYRKILAMTWKDCKADSLIKTIDDPELGDSVKICWKLLRNGGSMPKAHKRSQQLLGRGGQEQSVSCGM